MPTTILYDALVIGGGPAGLSAALTLARALQTAVVFDSGAYRNQRATHMHTLPTWDHVSPAQFRAAARKEILARYQTVQFQDMALTKVAGPISKGAKRYFEAVGDDGQLWRGRTVILANGVRDVLPDIEGYEDCWVKGIFHCLFCHGYEDRGASKAGVLAIAPIADIGPATHMARGARQLADKVTIYTDGNEALASSLSAGLRAEEAANIVLDSRPIARLEKMQPADSTAAVRIHFADGSAPEPEEFLVHRPKTEINGPFAQQLCLQLTPAGDIFTNPPFGETNVPGVFAAGDCAGPVKIVSNAIFTGSTCAAGATGKLQASYDIVSGA
jgi:gliotoxin/aspirochlorine biosynthesis thioredoxin reductase